MDNQNILSMIETILPKLEKWIIFKETSFEPNELSIAKDIAASILPGKVINWTCSPCASEVLTTMWSFYQREKNN